MTKAFTLIEILIAVTIMFTVGMGLLKVGSNSSKLITYAKAKTAANEGFSLSLLNAFCEDTDTNLYDAVKTNFTINDDKLITALKERNLTCESEEVLNIDLADNTDLNETLDNIPQISFTINKLSANVGGVNTIGYEIKAQM
ncbi:MAG: prepilin-type N-terminal cleavage/methylation domain-containing protein [Campylobacteraceae bacterium]|jgi:type II secretory pathway pseudopilin PulG|nr:prepilin-type N-terminal cleavage/methylation domain-containing protein [Campylobacteraceae bacterium]